MLVRKKLTDVAQTVRAVDAMAKKYANDIGKLAALPLPEYYRFVQLIPYRRDIPGREVVARPGIILGAGAIGRDCKKAAVMIGAWANKNRIPVRYVIVSSRRDKKPHHIYNELFIGGAWRPVDATYSHYKLFTERPYTYKRIFQF